MADITPKRNMLYHNPMPNHTCKDLDPTIYITSIQSMMTNWKCIATVIHLLPYKTYLIVKH